MRASFLFLIDLSASNLEVVWVFPLLPNDLNCIVMYENQISADGFGKDAI